MYVFAVFGYQYSDCVLYTEYTNIISVSESGMYICFQLHGWITIMVDQDLSFHSLTWNDLYVQDSRWGEEAEWPSG